MTKHLFNIFFSGFLLTSSVGFGQNDMIIFLSFDDTDGDLGSSASEVRANADLLCQEEAILEAAGLTIRAFLSINATDEIRDMPNNYKMPQSLPIKDEFGILVANNFSSLITNNLFRAIDTSQTENIFTGTDIGGSLASDNCNNWTSNTSFSGAVFQSDLIEFLGTGNQIPCSESLKLACLAFQPVADFEVEGFSRFGIDAPNIKMKHLTDDCTLPSSVSSTKDFDLGIDVSKILSIEILTKPEGLSNLVPPNVRETISGMEYEYDLQGSILKLRTTENNSDLILSSECKVFIIYSE